MISKQERFCQEYVRLNNGTQAAINAGYAKSGARTEASRMLAKPNIAARVAELQAEIKARTMLDVERRMEILAKIATEEYESQNDRMRAIDLLNKMTGEYTQRHEIDMRARVEKIEVVFVG